MRPQFNSWVGKIHWRRDRLPMPVFLGFPGGSAGKESACNEGDLGLIPGLGTCPGEGKGYPPQYSGLENSMDWIVPGVAKSWTWLSKFHFTSNKIKVDLPFMRLVSSPWLVWQPHSKKSSGTCPFLLSPLSGLSVTLRPTFQAEDEGVIRSGRGWRCY